ncbi:holin [Gordonia phage Lilbeanie]|uniref:Holin n=1 Tax=Gordonia phage Lilbeanie TaxID=2794947 RepID=A0A7T1KSA1_9CAUD|nr:holin [Gordonia phage Lilbeanie]QPO17119.1 holin [Gordonia phage Lilbeanie]
MTISRGAAFGLVVKDVAERALKSFVQGLGLFLVAGVGITSIPWGTAIQSAGLLALSTVLIAFTTASITVSDPWVEMLYRAARTFVAAIVAVIPISTPDHAFVFSDVNWVEAAGLAATLAVISVVTSIGSMPVGPKHTPSLVAGPRI